MGFYRVVNPLAVSKGRAFGGVWGNAPQTAFKRSAKGELKNSPVDCFLRGNALQVRASPYKTYTFDKKPPQNVFCGGFCIQAWTVSRIMRIICVSANGITASPKTSSRFFTVKALLTFMIP